MFDEGQHSGGGSDLQTVTPGNLQGDKLATDYIGWDQTTLELT